MISLRERHKLPLRSSGSARRWTENPGHHSSVLFKASWMLPERGWGCATGFRLSPLQNRSNNELPFVPAHFF